MESATIREVQHNLAAYLRRVEQGEDIVIRRRNKAVARLVSADAPEAVVRPPDWGQVRERREAMWGGKAAPGKPASGIVRDAGGPVNVYYDTGVLLPLYVEEAFSAVVSRIVEERAEPIALNQVQETEFGNAVRLKVFRRELSTARARQIMSACDEDIRMGRLIRRPVNWGQAFDETRRLSECVTVKTGCRTLDLVHVAIAMKWGCDHFVSADVRQLKAARLAGLKVLAVSV